MKTELSFVKQPFYYGSYNFWIMSYENRELSYKKGNPGPLSFFSFVWQLGLYFSTLGFPYIYYKALAFPFLFQLFILPLATSFFLVFHFFSFSLCFFGFFFSLLLLSNAYNIFEIFFTTYLNEELLLINKKINISN